MTLPSLGKHLHAPAPKRLQQWLEEVLRVPQLSASKDIYVFLSIGRTVDLLSKASRNNKNTLILRDSSKSSKRSLFSLRVFFISILILIVQ